MTGKRTLAETEFDVQYMKKYGSLMAQGNGYLGMRAANEEAYTEQTRGLYIAGIYNKAGAGEASDLVNLPDLAGMRIKIDGTVFSLLDGEICYYRRQLDLSGGELRRQILWKNREGARFHLLFQRFVSKADLHVLASKVTITSLDKDAEVEVASGIDAQQTNFGRQHLAERAVRVFDEEVMMGSYETGESGHRIAAAAIFRCDKRAVRSFTAKNRQLLQTVKLKIEDGKPYEFEKISALYTSLDRDLEGQEPEEACVLKGREAAKAGYKALFAASSAEWQAFWQRKQVKIASRDPFDQFALDFALYHLEIMAPSHDERFSVGAKGLTGEGYKGHVFWDSEIFILPFHLFTEPETARKLLRYRYLKLEGAKGKAAQNGYEGALFPWESAFSGREETPEFAAINIRTGERQRVASPLAEHHIAADIAYATVQYYEATTDEAFMKKEGLALLKETARFWISRATDEGGRLSLKDVIGPDEYTEHVDNNAFTNHMAHYNVKQALRFMAQFGEEEEAFKRRAEDFLDRLYLPEADREGLIPQDDTFLSLPEIDLAKYKEHQGSQGILLDYSRKEVNDMQILKQADVVMLLYLFPDLVPPETALRNLEYYEYRTIHDSSLSKAIHAIVAVRCGQAESAYRFFQEACEIDLGPDPNSSDEGLHSAALGALWLVTVFGFANIRAGGGVLSLAPKLPEQWTELAFPLVYRGRRLELVLSHEKLSFTKLSGPSMRISVSGEEFLLEDRLEITTVQLEGK
ncbi:glycoside hydrolase family 65 protein [Planomicrobium sp. CPCC 101110]|uniref:glycoside hydrolase family 65 protein n=1 Tax=Planomicrobium sp. CPCC 101110 TaxID=2599619 RepID=UPI0011B3F858|nr:glycoside hydrolase family 65 protein [Planomicrobium sp. CPCC 101110]TWT27274.1 glycoside hydrolase family 65 protein [Planomicrobium sp. CPCC 101110]